VKAYVEFMIPSVGIDKFHNNVNPFLLTFAIVRLRIINR
jgi:hypothetical protein